MMETREGMGGQLYGGKPCFIDETTVCSVSSGGAHSPSQPVVQEFYLMIHLLIDQQAGRRLSSALLIVYLLPLVAPVPQRIPSSIASLMFSGTESKRHGNTPHHSLQAAQRTQRPPLLIARKYATSVCERPLHSGREFDTYITDAIDHGRMSERGLYWSAL
ncbi:hypothetical protein BJV74DRAFT_836203, partial [Russula compacta]